MTSSLSYVLGPQNGEPCALQITAQSNNRVLVEVSNSDAQITLSVSVDIDALRRAIGYVGEEIHDEQILRDALQPGSITARAPERARGEFVPARILNGARISRTAYDPQLTPYAADLGERASE